MLRPRGVCFVVAVIDLPFELVQLLQELLQIRAGIGLRIALWCIAIDWHGRTIAQTARCVTNVTEGNRRDAPAYVPFRCQIRRSVVRPLDSGHTLDRAHGSTPARRSDSLFAVTSCDVAGKRLIRSTGYNRGVAMEVTLTLRRRVQLGFFACSFVVLIRPLYLFLQCGDRRSAPLSPRSCGR